MLRRIVRRFLPRREHPLLDRVERIPSDNALERSYLAAVASDSSDSFVAARYYEGTRWRTVLRGFVPPPARLLDLGAGNGAIELAMSAGGYKAFSVEREWNDVARVLRVRRVIADVGALPFRRSAFDVVLCLELIEHLSQVSAAVPEIVRVARADAYVLLTTPARWRYFLRRDPHFGIPLLTLFPASIQRRIAAARGFDQPHHYVDRIYASVTQIARTLLPLEVVVVLSRSRMPSRWFWDAILLRNPK
jgi:SAM-dependent methyltransferase